MLRALIVLLILLNALFFGWTRGWLDTIVGIKAEGDREPERMARQLHPERIRLLGESDVAALRQTSCVEFAGPLGNEAALQATQAAVARAGVAASAASAVSTELPGQWVVATIRLGSKDFKDRKEDTYKRLHIAYEPLTGVAAEELPALVLGRYASAAAANAALADFEGRALKGLRVLQLQAATKQYALRIPAADGALQARLKTAAAEDPVLSAGFKACAAQPAASTASAP